MQAHLPGVRLLNNGLTTAGLLLLSQLKQTLQTHPKRITAALTTLLLTTGGGAFAVASLAPDPAELPARTVTQAVQSLAEGEPLSALVDGPGFSLYRSDVTRGADTAESILQRLGVADPAAAAFLRADNAVRQNLLGRVGRSMSAEATDDHRLVRLTARWAQDDSDRFQRLVVERKPDGSFASRIESAPLTVGSRLAGGVIRSSLFAATDAASIPDAVAVQLAEVFSGDIDFRRALRKEDRFSVVYETLEADGEPLRSGRVLSAEFQNGEKTYNALWFQPPGAAKGAYYTLDGQKKSYETWTVKTAAKYAMPNVTPTAEESEEYSTIMNEVETYRDEMTNKFILGTESLDNFDQYVETLNSLGLQRAIEIQDAALERYNKR